MGKAITLGEIMLRLSTDQGKRLETSETFHAHYGGGEANVAISLANYGHEVGFASKVPDHAIGKAVKKHLQSYGVDTTHLLFGGPRLGSYYMETGVGERAASVIYDRAGSSFALMEENEWNGKQLFQGAEIFHISGITPALSQAWRVLTKKLMQEAKKMGCLVSFDINYRGKLWTPKEASETIQQLLPYVDICSAGELDARYLLGIKDAPEEVEQPLIYYYQKMQEKYPNINVFYSTKRKVHSASDNELQGTLWMDHGYFESQVHEITPIVDRVGGGDAFAGGVLHGILEKNTPQEIIDFATAASALKHTVHGDCNQFDQSEVARFLAYGSGKIVR
ncbi:MULTISPECIES: sugar kinase [Enterococcus]|uniref:sugar kinase n=1 Tax=Enterococcus TaxID=1350 RepID=UPI0011067E69|nr:MULTISPECIES: sugar kinase [Enterococcus]MBE8848659.1 sugar kinase [Enterococcus durans]MDB1652730.1 sugar kinase [Enterococcus durans]MDB1656541.1 sugar kinase [Enterococcus durans]MDB1664236.1 sugar kinase [Enterococcus durans]MDB1669490.1 sugar kinase [Enterococcus durans]